MSKKLDFAERATQPGPWTDEDRREITTVAGGFADMLRGHIHKEDAILYPMAEQHLSPETMERVSEDCERFENERTGSGEHERLHALAEELVARHASGARRPVAAPRHFGCG